MELFNTYETLTKQMAKGKDVPSFIYEAQTQCSLFLHCFDCFEVNI